MAESKSKSKIEYFDGKEVSNIKPKIKVQHIRDRNGLNKKQVQIVDNPPGSKPESWKVLPASFATEHKQMLAHLHMLVNNQYLAVRNEFDKVIISLRTAYAKEYSLDKEQTSYSDSLDALRLACKMYKIN
jgi:hypothetical protein